MSFYLKTNRESLLVNVHCISLWYFECLLLDLVTCEISYLEQISVEQASHLRSLLNSALYFPEAGRPDQVNLLVYLYLVL